MQAPKVLFRMWIICKIGAIILFKLNMAENGSAVHTRFVLWTVIFFLYELFAQLMTPKGKKRINKAPSKQSKQFHYFFKGFSFKTQFKIEFWTPVNEGQLVLE